MLITSGRCPICSTVGCGGPSDIVPVDHHDQEVLMSEGRPTPHRVRFNGRDTIMRLSEADAKRRGATPVTDRPAPAGEQPEPAKARTAQNKARGPGQTKTD